MAAPLYKIQSPSDLSFDLSREPNHVPSFPRAEGLSPSDRTGGTGLYMNCSIIFTEISFYPETPILSQIIHIIHITFQMKAEYDG